jgi:hypothetical protein
VSGHWILELTGKFSEPEDRQRTSSVTLRIHEASAPFMVQALCMIPWRIAFAAK